MSKFLAHAFVVAVYVFWTMSARQNANEPSLQKKDELTFRFHGKDEDTRLINYSITVNYNFLLLQIIIINSSASFALFAQNKQLYFKLNDEVIM